MSLGSEFYHVQIADNTARLIVQKEKGPDPYDSLMTLASAKIVEANSKDITILKDWAIKDISVWGKIKDFFVSCLSSFGFLTTTEKINQAYENILSKLRTAKDSGSREDSLKNYGRDGAKKFDGVSDELNFIKERLLAEASSSTLALEEEEESAVNESPEEAFNAETRTSSSEKVATTHTRPKLPVQEVRAQLDDESLYGDLKACEDSLRNLENSHEFFNHLKRNRFDEASLYEQYFTFNKPGVDRADIEKKVRIVVSHHAARHYINTQQWNKAEEWIAYLKYPSVQNPYREALKVEKVKAAPFLDPLASISSESELREAVKRLPENYRDSGRELSAANRTSLTRARMHAFLINDEARRSRVVEENQLYLPNEVLKFSHPRMEVLNKYIREHNFKVALGIVDDMHLDPFIGGFNADKKKALKNLVAHMAAKHYVEAGDYEAASDFAKNLLFTEDRQSIEDAIRNSV